MPTLNATKARQDFFILLDKIEKSSAPFTITIKGEPKAVIMSAEEFEGWVETLDVMKDFPNLEKDIKRARDDFQKGDIVTLDEIMAQEGYIAIENSKKKHVSSRRQQKSPKRPKKNK